MINKATVKYIQSLQHKKFRDEHHAFIAEGPKPVSELLAGGNFECEDIFCTEKGMELLKGNPAGKLSRSINIIADFELEKISALSTPNNMLAVFKKKRVNDQPDIRQKLSLVLDDIQDPGNLGTIIRIADWFGLQHIFCSAATADCYNPKVVQSTMASLGRVNILYGDLKKVLEDHEGIKKYAAVLGAEDVRSVGKIKEGMIIIGNESKGISAELLQLVDQKISIEKTGDAESLNAAVATGIILFSVT